MKPSPRFRDWLSDALGQSGLSKREVARRMAAKHPKGVSLDTIETGRRTLNKILSGDLTPTQPTRDTIASALERDDAPSEADDEEDEVDAALLNALVREQAEISRKISRALVSLDDHLRLRVREILIEERNDARVSEESI
jgi:transcriptional regulator with XRE-family HTH domain